MQLIEEVVEKVFSAYAEVVPDHQDSMQFQRVFSAYAEVVLISERENLPRTGILRMRGGSSWDMAWHTGNAAYSPHTRKQFRYHGGLAIAGCHPTI